MKEEICEECSRIIGIAEQAYIYEGRIVCEICDKKLRQEPRQDQQLRQSQAQEDLESTDIFKSIEFPEPEELAESQEPEGVKESIDIFESLETQETKKN